MPRIIIAALAVVFLSGCAELLATPEPKMKTGFPVGGSQADGTVTLVYEYGRYETYQVNWEDMQKQAQDMCMGWGYNTAEKVGGELSDCTEHSIETDERCVSKEYIYPGGSYCDGYKTETKRICQRWRASIMYQCQTREWPISLSATSTALLQIRLG